MAQAQCSWRTWIERTALCSDIATSQCMLPSPVSTKSVSVPSAQKALARAR